MLPKAKPVKTSTKPTASAAAPSTVPPTSAHAPVKAPVKAVAPIPPPSNSAAASTPTKQPQTPASGLAGKWAQKLPGTGAASSPALPTAPAATSAAPAGKWTQTLPGTGATAPTINASAPGPIPAASAPISPSQRPLASGLDTSASQTPPAGPAGILNLGDGLLSLAEGYEFNEEQIMTFLSLVKRPAGDASDLVRNVAKGIQTFILTANNDKIKTLATWEYPQRPPPRTTEEEIAKPLTEASEAQQKGPNSLALVPSLPDRKSALRKYGVEVRGNKDIMLLAFQGVNLPIITIYDYLAWLLSMIGSSETQTVAKTPQNYYLPLLALYSRWCTTISNLIKFDSLPMVHISWWGKTVLLGATLGDVPEVPRESSSGARQNVYIEPRQTILNNLGFKQPRADPDGKQNFGRCAETFLFIMIKTKGIPANTIQGFAMIPADVLSLPMNEAIRSARIDQQPPRTPQNATSDPNYQKALTYRPSSLQLVPPCAQSCQNIFKQLKWDWRIGFGMTSSKKGSLGVNPNSGPAKDPNAPRSTPTTLGHGGKGEGGETGESGLKPPDVVDGTQPIHSTFPGLTPAQRKGNTPDQKIKNKKAYGVTKKTKVEKISPKPWSEANVAAVGGALPLPVRRDSGTTGVSTGGYMTPSQMMGNTAAAIASPALGAIMTGLGSRIMG